jgi:hypothetical protein
MSMHKKLKQLRRFIALLALVPFLIILPGLAQDGADDPGNDGSYCSSRKAQALVEQLGFDCQAMEAQGVGLGEIEKARRMSQSLPGFEGDWEALLQRKQEGLGWGEIRKAQALDDAGILGFDEALESFQNGVGWGDIKAELGLEGPPPWAGNGKDKGNKHGPPPWANGQGRGAE